MATQNINLSFVKTFSNLGKSSSPTPIDPAPQKGVYVPTKVVEQKAPSIEQFRVFSGSAVLPEAMDPSRFKIHNEGSDEPYGGGVGLPVNLSLDEMLSDGRFLSLDNTVVQDFNYNFSFSASARLNPDYFYQPELSGNSKLKVNEDYRSLGYAEEVEYEADKKDPNSASRDFEKADRFKDNVQPSNKFSAEWGTEGEIIREESTIDADGNEQEGKVLYVIRSGSKALASSQKKYYRIIPPKQGEIPEEALALDSYYTNSEFVNAELRGLGLTNKSSPELLRYAENISKLNSNSKLESVFTPSNWDKAGNTSYLSNAAENLIQLLNPTLSAEKFFKDKSYKDNYDHVFSSDGSYWEDVKRGVIRSSLSALSDITEASFRTFSNAILGYGFNFLNIQLGRRAVTSGTIFIRGTEKLIDYSEFNIGVGSAPVGVDSKRKGAPLPPDSTAARIKPFFETLIKSKKPRKVKLSFNYPEGGFRYGIPHYSIMTEAEWGRITKINKSEPYRSASRNADGSFKSTEGFKSTGTFLDSVKNALSKGPTSNEPIEIQMLPSFNPGDFIGGAQSWVTDDVIAKFRSLQDISFADQDRDNSSFLKELMRKDPLLSQSQFSLYIYNPFEEDKYPAKRWNDKVVKSPKNRHEPTYDSKVHLIESLKNLRGFRLKSFEIPETSRNSTVNSYGNSALSLLSNSQASSDHTAIVTFICDKKLKELKDLIELTGNGLLIKQELASDESSTLVYDLSSIADNHNGYVTEAMLQIENGAQIINALLNSDDRENAIWKKYIPLYQRSTAKDPLNEPSMLGITPQPVDLSNFKLKPLNFPDPSSPTFNLFSPITIPVESTQQISNLDAGLNILPSFYFMGFKIIDLNYNLSFEAGNEAKLLEIQATVTWNRLLISPWDPNLQGSHSYLNFLFTHDGLKDPVPWEPYTPSEEAKKKEKKSREQRKQERADNKFLKQVAKEDKKEAKAAEKEVKAEAKTAVAMDKQAAKEAKAEAKAASKTPEAKEAKAKAKEAERNAILHKKGETFVDTSGSPTNYNEIID